MGRGNKWFKGLRACFCPQQSAEEKVMHVFNARRSQTGAEQAKSSLKTKVANGATTPLPTASVKTIFAVADVASAIDTSLHGSQGPGELLVTSSVATTLSSRSSDFGGSTSPLHENDSSTSTPVDAKVADTGSTPDDPAHHEAPVVDRLQLLADTAVAEGSIVPNAMAAGSGAPPGGGSEKLSRSQKRKLKKREQQRQAAALVLSVAVHSVASDVATGEAEGIVVAADAPHTLAGLADSRTPAVLADPNNGGQGDPVEPVVNSVLSPSPPFPPADLEGANKQSLPTLEECAATATAPAVDADVAAAPALPALVAAGVTTEASAAAIASEAQAAVLSGAEAGPPAPATPAGGLAVFLGKGGSIDTQPGATDARVGSEGLQTSQMKPDGLLADTSRPIKTQGKRKGKGKHSKRSATDSTHALDTPSTTHPVSHTQVEVKAAATATSVQTAAVPRGAEAQAGTEAPATSTNAGRRAGAVTPPSAEVGSGAVAQATADSVGNRAVEPTIPVHTGAPGLSKRALKKQKALHKQAEAASTAAAVPDTIHAAATGIQAADSATIIATEAQQVSPSIAAGVGLGGAGAAPVVNTVREQTPSLTTGGKDITASKPSAKEAKKKGSKTKQATATAAAVTAAPATVNLDIADAAAATAVCPPPTQAKKPEGARTPCSAALPTNHVPVHAAATRSPAAAPTAGDKTSSARKGKGRGQTVSPKAFVVDTTPAVTKPAPPPAAANAVPAPVAKSVPAVPAPVAKSVPAVAAPVATTPAATGAWSKPLTATLAAVTQQTPNTGSQITGQVQRVAAPRHAVGPAGLYAQAAAPRTTNTATDHASSSRPTAAATRPASQSQPAQPCAAHASTRASKAAVAPAHAVTAAQAAASPTSQKQTVAPGDAHISTAPNVTANRQKLQHIREFAARATFPFSNRKLIDRHIKAIEELGVLSQDQLLNTTEALRAAGFKMAGTHGQGDCLPMTGSDQLFGNQHQHDMVRTLCRMLYQLGWQSEKQGLTSDVVNQLDKADGYDERWCGAPDLVAISNIWNCRIALINGHLAKPILVITPDDCEDESSLEWLTFYFYDQHYSSVVAWDNSFTKVVHKSNHPVTTAGPPRAEQEKWAEQVVKQATGGNGAGPVETGAHAGVR